MPRPRKYHETQRGAPRLTVRLEPTIRAALMATGDPRGTIERMVTHHPRLVAAASDLLTATLEDDGGEWTSRQVVALEDLRAAIEGMARDSLRAVGLLQ